jgi:WhiB family transcriptional regulator, redox-sensing transcriptional regulator
MTRDNRYADADQEPWRQATEGGVPPRAQVQPQPKLRGKGWDLWDVLPDRPAWHDLAACRGVGPRTFFPRTDDRRIASDRRYKFALKYCRDCPVVAECRAAGEAEIFGLWGGLTPSERASRRAKAG